MKVLVEKQHSMMSVTDYKLILPTSKIILMRRILSLIFLISDDIFSNEKHENQVITEKNIDVRPYSDFQMLLLLQKEQSTLLDFELCLWVEICLIKIWAYISIF